MHVSLGHGFHYFFCLPFTLADGFQRGENNIIEQISEYEDMLAESMEMIRAWTFVKLLLKEHDNSMTILLFGLLGLMLFRSSLRKSLSLVTFIIMICDAAQLLG